MTFRRLFFLCGYCDSQLIRDDSTGEVFCGGCGVVHDSMENAKPMGGVQSSREPEIEKEIMRRKPLTTKRHAGGRPRTRSYVRIRTLDLRYHEKFVRPLKTEKVSDVEKLLWTIVTRSFKHAMFEHIKATGVPWSHIMNKGQVFKCPKHKRYHEGSNLECTVDPKHARIRVLLPCKYPLDLKMWCPFCGYQIKASKKFFQCSNRKGPRYPDRCFRVPLDEAEAVAKEQFRELL